MKYLLFSLLSLVAIAGHGQTSGTLLHYGPGITYSHCGTWERDKDTISNWETVDTLGNFFKQTQATIYIIPQWVYGPIQPESYNQEMDLLNRPCGGDPSTYQTQDRIDPRTGIRQRQTTWEIYHYVEYQLSPFDRLMDSLQIYNAPPFDSISSQWMTSGGDSIYAFGRNKQGTIPEDYRIEMPPHILFEDSVDVHPTVTYYDFYDTTTMIRASLRSQYIILDPIITKTITIGDAVYIVQRRKNHVWLTRETSKP